MTSTLSGWLATRSRDDLAAILVRRPETVHARHLGEAAARLQAPYAIENVLRELPKPCLELVETLVVFGAGGIDRKTLAGLVGAAVDDATFIASLDVLALWVLAWEADDGLIHTPGALRTVLPRPLGLGPPVVDLLTLRAVDDLRSRAATLGLAVPSGKAEIVAVLADFYTDADAVRALYDAAPSAQRELLVEAAWRGPVLPYEGSFFYTGRPDPAISWLLTHGLVIADWQQIVVPREVALAVRGAGWHPTLTAQPAVATTPVTDVEAGAAAAANATVEQVAALVEACATAAVPVLKTGGVGVRELRRLAKAAGLPDPLVRLCLALAARAGLLDTGGPDLLPTPDFDEWRAADPGHRLATLVRAWAELSTVPMLAERPDDGPPRAALAEDPYGSVAAELRGDVLNIGLHLPAGAGVTAVTGIGSVATMAAWRRPLLATLLGDVSYAVTAVWTEAEQLGLVARGALSPLGRALVAARSPVPPAAPPFGPVPGEPPAEPLDEVAARFASDCAGQAIFQADLTVVVTGRPSADLAALLDAVADRESQGVATTWRCSPGSVRRALDAGRDAPGLLDELRAVAAATLPQPLEYLIGDVARRHGAVRVRTVGCVLRADDPTLLAEIAAARPLAALRLLPLAPTVLASTQDVTTTLAALRAAGYAPVGETTDGVPLLERVAARRSTARAAAVPQPRHPVADPYALAAALLAAPVVADEPPPQPTLRLLSTPARVSTSSVVGRYATHLSVAEQHLLATAIDESQPVRIAYTSGEGVPTARVIEPIELEGGMLVAWCRLRDGERNFVLARIGAVTPAR